jgi:glycosyltransferase involved in cell wall biosynthesis
MRKINPASENAHNMAEARSTFPFVSVVIPCRNEAKWIQQCLESVAANDYPKEKLEVFVLDGMSDDATAAIVAEFADKHPWVQLVENPRRTAPAALNIGIQRARGQVVMRMDAHNEYPANYISRLVHWLENTDADNVGGLWITRPSSDTAIAKAIAFGCSHPFGVGNARYRTGVKEPCKVDTVPFGCYRRDVFDRIGLFDEELVRDQDNEFNQRLINAGGTILLVPDVTSYYHARGTLEKLWRMYYQYGYFNALVVRKIGGGINVRHWVPLIFVMALLASLALSLCFAWSKWLFGAIAVAYLVPLIACSAIAAVRAGWRVGLWMPLVFAAIHFGKGLGSLHGAVVFLLFRKRVSTSETANIRTTR